MFTSEMRTTPLRNSKSVEGKLLYIYVGGRLQALGIFLSGQTIKMANYELVDIFDFYYGKPYVRRMYNSGKYYVLNEKNEIVPYGLYRNER